MALDIIEIDLTVDGDAAHAAGDVVFELTEFSLPARACKIINAFYQFTGTAISECALRCLFFQSNDGGSLTVDGTLNTTADITSSNFKLNNYIGHITLLNDAGGLGGTSNVDYIDNMVIYAMASSNIPSDVNGIPGGGTTNTVLKQGSGDTSFSHGMYVAGVQITGAQDYVGDQTDAKLILHVEY